MNSNVTGTSIEIDNTVLEGIRSHVAGQYPAEACGVLLKQIGGSEVTTVRIRQFCMAENCSQGSDSLDSYRINPLRLFRMEQYWSEFGFEVAGFYHSHPGRRAVPSDRDLDGMIPELAYMIFSVTPESVYAPRVWKKTMSDGSAVEMRVAAAKQNNILTVPGDRKER